MAAWAKIKLFWDTMLGSAGSSLSATSTASGYSVNDIYNWLETNMWKAGAVTPPQTITYDAGAGNTKTADYIVIFGHNLFTAGASVYLEWSDDNVNWTTVWSTTPTVNTVLLGEFTQTAGHRYWRVRLFKSPTNFNEAPYMAICVWGNKTELDWASASFDPHGQEDKRTVNRSYGGVVAGIHTAHTDRKLTLAFDDADSTLYGKIKTWRETHGSKQFFIAWEAANSPNDVWLMFPDAAFNNPLTKGGAYRSISLSFTGRKE